MRNISKVMRDISTVIVFIFIGVLLLWFRCCASDDYEKIVVKNHRIMFHKSLKENFVKCFIAVEFGIHDLSVEKFGEAKWRLNMNGNLYVI